MKLLHTAKHFEENFLGGIGRIRGIGEDSVNQAVNRLMKFSYQPGISLFRTRLKFGDDARLFSSNSDRAREIAHVGYSRQKSQRNLHYRSNGTAHLYC